MADSVIIRIDGDDKGYQKALNNVKSGVESLNKIAKKVALGLGTVGASVVGLGVKYNAEMEQYMAGFTTMLGSAEKADKVLSNLKSFAEKTPFELTDLANASTTLLAFGEDVENLMPDLKMLGDISLGNKEKFKSLALVFGQVQSQGKLMGQDLLQMINSGFNPLQVISEKTGESMASLKDKMSDGQISFEMVAEAMRIATSEGGQFYNAMEQQSKTLVGQWSTLKDNVTSLAGDISSGISSKLTERALPLLIEKVEDLKQAWADGTLIENVKKFIVVLVSGASAIVTYRTALITLEILQKVSAWHKATTTALSAYTVAITANTAATTRGITIDSLLISTLSPLQVVYGVLTGKIKLATAAQAAMNAVSKAHPYALIITALTAVTAGVVTYALTHESAAKKIRKAHEEAIKSIDENISADMAQAETARVLKNQLYELEEQIHSGTLTEQEATNAKETFKGVSEQLNEIVPGIIENIGNENDAYAIQRGAVNDLTDSFYELAKAKAIANAYQAKIDETAKSLVEVNEKLKPYETGEKPKEVEKRFSFGGDRFYTTVKDQEYLDLLDTQTALDNKMKGYYEELSKYKTEKPKDEPEDEPGGNGFKGITNALKTESQKQTDILKEQREKELRDLKYAHDIGEKSDEEYYKALGEYRDKYFEVGSEEWQKYSLEIKRYKDGITDNRIKDIKQELEGKNLLTSAKKQEAENAYKLWSSQNRNASELQKNTKEASYLRTALEADIEQLNDLKSAYAEMEEATGANSAESIALRQTIEKLIISIQDTKNSLDDIKEKNKQEYKNDLYKGHTIRGELLKQGYTYEEALEISEQLGYGIAEEVPKAEKDIPVTLEITDIETDSPESYEAISELKTEFEKVFEEIPEGFFSVGEESANQFGKGFRAKFEEIKKELEAMVSDFISSMMSSLSVVSASGSGVTNNNTTSVTYNVQPSQGESTTAQLAAIRNAETVAKLRGDYVV